MVVVMGGPCVVVLLLSLSKRKGVGVEEMEMQMKRWSGVRCIFEEPRGRIIHHMHPPTHTAQFGTRTRFSLSCAMPCTRTWIWTKWSDLYHSTVELLEVLLLLLCNTD